MKINEWIKRANRWFREHNFLDSPDIVFRYENGGIRAFLKNIILSSGGSNYAGPFAVVKASDTSVNVYGYNAAEGRYFNSYVILGLSRVEFADTEGATSPITGTAITASGYVYLEITYSGGYAVVAKFATSLPDQNNTHIYHPIARIVCADSIISSILQLQYGNVHFPARGL
jgi:hypothetical protein